MKKILLILFLVCCFSLCGCSAGQTDTEPEELTVFAAASLKNVMTELTPLFEEEHNDVKLTFNYGGSGDLQKQIENGAPCDVFISAAQKQMNALEEQGLLADGTREDVLKNTLVLIVPKNSALTSVEDLKNPDLTRVALGEPSTVPAGQYAEEALTHLGLIDAVRTKAVYAKDVTQVLTYVKSGEADAGVVYKTDALSSDAVKIAAIFPADSYTPVTYPAAAIKDSVHADAAKAFLEFLKSDAAKKAFEQAGFSPL